VQNLCRGHYDIATEVPSRHRLRVAAAGFTVTTVPLTALGRREDGSPKARLVLARTVSTP
jgi:hypothetical protein